MLVNSNNFKKNITLEKSKNNLYILPNLQTTCNS